MDLVICLLFVAYLFPFAVAARYEHEHLGRILVANLLLGWTGIGWLAVLGWARHPAVRPPEPVMHGHLRRPAAPGHRLHARPPARSHRPRHLVLQRRARPGQQRHGQLLGHDRPALRPVPGPRAPSGRERERLDRGLAARLAGVDGSERPAERRRITQHALDQEREVRPP